MSPLLKLRRSRGPADLAVDMAGVRMGERFLHVGAGVPRVFALVSSKVGLTGRACAVVDTAADKTALELAAARHGVFVEVAVAAAFWPYDPASFDIALVDANALLGAPVGDRQSRLAATVRVVRPGGRVLAVGRRPRGVLARLGFEPATAAPGARAVELLRALEAAGCRPVRVLAEREGFVFVEGFVPVSA